MTDIQYVGSTLTHYVKYYGPGSLNFEGDDVVVAERDADTVARSAPSYVDAFRFYDILTLTVTLDGYPVETSSVKLNPSPRYYINADVCSFDELEERLPGNPPALRQLKAQGGDSVILCRSGRFERTRSVDSFVKVS